MEQNNTKFHLTIQQNNSIMGAAMLSNFPAKKSLTMLQINYFNLVYHGEEIT